jgi:hypothetical protein
METTTLPPPIPSDDVGARAIEIAALLGDSVVEVKHLTSPRGGRVTGATRAMLAGGAALLALSAFAFAAGVANAAANQRALHSWVDVEEKPVADFRPERLPLAYDWMAFGGALRRALLRRCRRPPPAPRARVAELPHRPRGRRGSPDRRRRRGVVRAGRAARG